MSLFALSGLLAGVSATLMAGFVYFTNRAARANQLWAIFSMALSVWGFSAALIGVTTDARLALVWWRIAHAGVILIPPLFYHFVTAFAQIRRPKTVACLYLIGTGFLLADLTPLLVTRVRSVFGQFTYPASPNPLYILFVLFFVGVTAFSHVELWRRLRWTKQRARQLLFRWFFISSSIGFAGGFTCFLPVFGVDLYPYGILAIPVFPILMLYAFIRHRLLDVDLALARGVTFLGTYALAVGLPFYVGHRYQLLWQTVLGPWWWVAPVVLMGLMASASPIVFLSIVHQLEQRLWQSQRRYHRTLIAASSGMTRIKEILRLCRLIAYMVNRAVGLTNTGFFLYEPKEHRYVLRAVRYPSLIPLHQAVDQADPLIALLEEKRDLVVLDEVLAEAEASRDPERTQRLTQVCEWMQRLEARLIVPSFSNDRLLAFLVLGAKQSGEPYTTDDIAVFSGLANQAALAIENAMFFEELRANEAYMIQSEKLASLGQLASGMAHEIHNPLTIISGEAQLYLERFKGQEAKVDAVLASIIEECKRAADITRRILRFAKPSPADFAPVDPRAVIEEALTLAGYQVRMDRFECAVHAAGDLPKIRGNQNQLQEVLLNLVLNACQAMGEQGGKLTLSAFAENSQVVLKVEDTGPGIPAALLRKVFDPFYTTKASGTGLGLFVSQRIVKGHGGTMELESAEGQGACFTIRLPALPSCAPSGKVSVGASEPVRRDG